ncbi:hypothetical protein DPMN_010259 [Dreissena polymorpha]|uniref:Uncharacterized protein n=1 Tax=Dreissena polymorpha TaxID=45954 RepID=A0A9D4N3X3_DREPO|nr:hypothetical protein DPMN_010259 [Dreissena polymorpha]
MLVDTSCVLHWKTALVHGLHPVILLLLHLYQTFLVSERFSETLAKALYWLLSHCQMSFSLILKRNQSCTFLFFRTKLLDLTGMNFILDHEISRSKSSNIHLPSGSD